MTSDHILRAIGRQAAEHWDIVKGETAVAITIDCCKKVGIPYKGHRSIKTLKEEHGIEMTIHNQQEAPLIWEAIMIASRNDITEFVSGYIVRIEVATGTIKAFPIEPTAEQLAEYKTKVKGDVE